MQTAHGHRTAASLSAQALITTIRRRAQHHPSANGLMAGATARHQADAGKTPIRSTAMQMTPANGNPAATAIPPDLADNHSPKANRAYSAGNTATTQQDVMRR